MRRTIKMNTEIPFWLESKLVNKYGYYIQKRFPGEYILFVKMSNTTVSSNNINQVVKPDVPSLGRQMTAAEEHILEQRCDTIVDFFPKPYDVVPSVRARLNNMRQTLQSVEEQQFVLEYMDYNFPLDVGDQALSHGGL